MDSERVGTMLGQIGMSELFIIFVVALVVFDPRRDGTAPPGGIAPPDGLRADTRPILKEPRSC